MADNKEVPNTTAAKICRYCGANVDLKSPKCVKCVVCVGVFHLSCSRRVKNLETVDDQPNSVICCGKGQAAAVNMAECVLLCHLCKNRINNRYDDIVKCVQCEQRLHIGCAGIDINGFSELRANGALERWLCGQCTSSSDATNVNDSDGGSATATAMTTTKGNLEDTAENPQHGALSLASSDDKDLSLVLDKRNVASMLDCLEKLVCSSKPCECDKMIKPLIDDNKKLRELIRSQSASIRAMKDEFRSQLKEIKDMLSSIKVRQVPKSDDVDVTAAVDNFTQVNALPNALARVPLTSKGSKVSLQPTEQGGSRPQSQLRSSLESNRSGIRDKNTLPLSVSVEPSVYKSGPLMTLQTTEERDVQPIDKDVRQMENSTPATIRGQPLHSSVNKRVNNSEVNNELQNDLLNSTNVPEDVDNATQSVNIADGTDKAGFKTVTYKNRHVAQQGVKTSAGKHGAKPRNKVVILGKAEGENTAFRAVQIKPKHWFHISRFPLDVTEDEVSEFIKQRFDLQDCFCVKLVPKKTNGITFSSFKIGIDADKGDDLMDPDKWPRGIALSRWHFFPKTQRSQQLK